MNQISLVSSFILHPFHHSGSARAPATRIVPAPERTKDESNLSSFILHPSSFILSAIGDRQRGQVDAQGRNRQPRSRAPRPMPAKLADSELSPAPGPLARISTPSPNTRGGTPRGHSATLRRPSRLRRRSASPNPSARSIRPTPIPSPMVFT